MNKKTKSPLTGNPLRNPGQSGDERINTLLNDEASPYLIIIAFLPVMAGLEWWKWYTEAPYAPGVITAIAVVFVSVSTYKIFGIRKKVRKLKLGRDAEKVVGQYLEELREQGYRIFHDIIGDGNFNLDHVIVCEHGVFTIETKARSKPVSGEPKITIKNEDIFIDNYHDKEILTQARAEANWLKNLLLETTGKNIKVKPVVVFPGWYVDSAKASKGLGVWVLNPKALPAFIQNNQKILSTDMMLLISYHISRYVRTTP